MTFLEALEADLDVFMNVEEFAVIRELEGVLLKVSYQFYRDEVTGRQSDEYAGLHGDHVALTFRAADFLKKKDHLPREGERIKFRDKLYGVTRSENEFGLCRLECVRYRGRHG